MEDLGSRSEKNGRRSIQCRSAHSATTQTYILVVTITIHTSLICSLTARQRKVSPPMRECSIASDVFENDEESAETREMEEMLDDNETEVVSLVYFRVKETIDVLKKMTQKSTINLDRRHQIVAFCGEFASYRKRCGEMRQESDILFK